MSDENENAAHSPVFRAEDIAAHRPVSVQLLDRDEPLDGVRSTVERLAAAPHPNLVRNHAFSSCRGQPFIVREWINGFSLSEVLRARSGILAPTEVRRLVEQAADAWEHIQVHELGSLDLHPDAIQVHFSGEAPEIGQRRLLLARPMDSWPDFSVKFRVYQPLSLEQSREAAALVRETVRSLGYLTAELLGGGTSTVALASVEDAPAVHFARRHSIRGESSHRPGGCAGTPILPACMNLASALVEAFQEDESRPRIVTGSFCRPM